MGYKTNEVAVPQFQRMNWGELRGGVGTIVRLLRNELTTRILEAYAPFGLRSGALSTLAADTPTSLHAINVAANKCAMIRGDIAARAPT